MKIAQISTPWLRTPPNKYGGVEQGIAYLTNELVELGHDVTLFATGDSLTRGKLWSWYDTPTNTFLATDQILHLIKAYDFISTQGFDIIHNHSSVIGPALFSLPQLRNIPCVTTFHNAKPQTEKYYDDACSRAHRYVSMSKRQQYTMPGMNWIGNIYNGLKAEDFNFQENKMDYLLFIGLLAPRKGPEIAIRLAKSLGRRLKIAGPIQKGFEKSIIPQMDSDLIEYIGEVNFEQKVSLYQNASALLVPIQWEEPFGWVMIEAMACGTPVIAFRRGSASEIIIDTKTGFLVDTIEEMRAAIIKIDQISPRECRNHVEKHFNVRLMAERYVKIYQDIIYERL